MSNVFFNEIHYENRFLDYREGVEIAAPAGTNLDGWLLSIYDGNGTHQGDRALGGLISNLQNGFGVVYIPVKLPNHESGHGLALISKDKEVVDFISWTRKVAARDGPAAGQSSFLLPVQESEWRTAGGSSLQLAGTGNKKSDFQWQKSASETFSGVNNRQKFIPLPKPAVPVPVPSEPSEPSVPVPVPSEPAPAPVPQPSPQVLQSIDLLVAQNRVAHHTDKLHAQEYFAVRRGQEFAIGLSAANEVTQATIKFTVYPETKQTFTIQVANTAAGNPETEWFAYFSGSENGKKKVLISIPGRAIVGKYTISVTGDNGKTWTPAEPVYVLFNSWSKYDDVFLDNENERNEYVLGEDGFIWVGSYFNFGPRPWNFAQFNTKTIEAALFLLTKIPVGHRNDIVLVSRALSALVNSQDDQGVLVGNWSSDYSGGTSPSAWTGSSEILKQYIVSGKPVRFGQCWVYSGVLTTVCRTLGIPARSVTNFASAHDTPSPDYNRSVDKYFLADGVTEDENQTSDSVWNFHVWNDAWFSRRDLGNSKFTGWQAIDGTPQERSNGKFQMGPVPVSAVKQGLTGVNYDLEFVYSEVNADEKYYVADGRGGYKLVRTITDSIGKSMSTKAVGSSARNDVTLEYKYKEKSPEERASHQGDQTGPVKVKLEVDQTTKLGQTISAKLQLSSSSNTTVKVQLSAGIITYTGKPVTTLLQKTETVKVSPGASISVAFDLPADVYVPKLRGTNGILFKAYVWVQETDQATIVDQEFDFVADDIKLEIKGDLKVGKDGKLVVTFHNPLKINLNNAELTVEATDLTKVQRFKYPVIKAGETLTQEVELYAWSAGKKTVAAMLDSDEINDLRGHIEVSVNK